VLGEGPAGLDRGACWAGSGASWARPSGTGRGSWEGCDGSGQRLEGLGEGPAGPEGALVALGRSLVAQGKKLGRGRMPWEKVLQGLVRGHVGRGIVRGRGGWDSLAATSPLEDLKEEGSEGLNG